MPPPRVYWHRGKPSRTRVRPVTKAMPNGHLDGGDPRGNGDLHEEGPDTYWAGHAMERVLQTPSQHRLQDR